MNNLELGRSVLKQIAEEPGLLDMRVWARRAAPYPATEAVSFLGLTDEERYGADLGGPALFHDTAANAAARLREIVETAEAAETETAEAACP